MAKHSTTTQPDDPFTVAPAKPARAAASTPPEFLVMRRIDKQLMALGDAERRGVLAWLAAKYLTPQPVAPLDERRDNGYRAPATGGA